MEHVDKQILSLLNGFAKKIIERGYYGLGANLLSVIGFYSEGKSIELTQYLKPLIDQKAAKEQGFTGKDTKKVKTMSELILKLQSLEKEIKDSGEIVLGTMINMIISTYANGDLEKMFHSMGEFIGSELSNLIDPGKNNPLN